MGGGGEITVPLDGIVVIFQAPVSAAFRQDNCLVATQEGPRCCEQDTTRGDESTAEHNLLTCKWKVVVVDYNNEPLLHSTEQKKKKKKKTNGEQTLVLEVLI